MFLHAAQSFGLDAAQSFGLDAAHSIAELMRWKVDASFLAPIA
jgi:hypothetical protein